MKAKESPGKEVKAGRREQQPGRWMAPGTGAGAALGILYGSYVLGPAMGSQTVGVVLGMSMGAGTGLVMGLSQGSREKPKPVFRKRRKS